MLLIQPKAIIRKIYPKAIWNLDRKVKNIYLTFDDGPIPELTEWVLDQLAFFQAKATFFCVGSNILRHPQIFERIKTDGHAVGNHTVFHTKGFITSTDAYVKEVDDCKELVKTNLFRPPYGRMKFRQYKTLLKKGYKIILWDTISYDYEKISETQCAKNVIENAKNGSIVLFHDNIKAEKNLKFALPLFLKHFSDLGYTFRHLEE